MTTHRVFLLRHGDAASHGPDGTPGDEGRELTTGGVERLRAACRTYRRVVGSPAAVLHSPLARARQSAELLAEATGTTDRLHETAELGPGGRTTRLVDLVQVELLGGADSIALVGHEPLLGDLLGLLATGNDRISLPLATGMLAGVVLADPQVMVGRLVTVLAQSTAVHLAD